MQITCYGTIISLTNTFLCGCVAFATFVIFTPRMKHKIFQTLNHLQSENIDKNHACCRYFTWFTGS